MNQYRDNYPYNVEKPQRVYVQYSQDIDFDYSNNQYPLGEEHEGFIWEEVYIPIPHKSGSLDLERHVWMRWRIGESESWSLPMRFTDSFSNIESTELEEVVGTDQVRFKLKFTLANGDIIYSEYITLTNGIDGRGIINSEIVNNNLILTYSDSTTSNLGRVVGYDGQGFPSAGSTVPGAIAIVDNNGNIIWLTIEEIFDQYLTADLPIEFSSLNISHSNLDGYRHIPTGGISGDVLTTDGSGNYTWFSLDNPSNGFIPWSAIDDASGVGDTTNLWSSDKIATMFGSINTFGIKYAVDFIVDLASIIDMDEDDLAVVNEDRYVYKYNGSAWIAFFALDGPHNHNDLYYTKTEMNTPGAITIDWTNISNSPTLYDYWTIIADSGSNNITNTEALSIVGGSGASTSLVGNTLTINATGSSYTNGAGLSLVGTEFSHSDTSAVLDTANTGGYMVQNLTFDTFGHVTSRTSLNLDTRYSLTTHSHAILTRGSGLTGSNYNGSAATTWNVNFGTSAGTVAEGNHTHTTLPTISYLNYGIFAGGSGNLYKVSYSFSHNLISLYAFGSWSPSTPINRDTIIGSIPVGYRPYSTYAGYIKYQGTNGETYDCSINIDLYGVIRIGRSGSYSGAVVNLNLYATYIGG